MGGKLRRTSATARCTSGTSWSTNPPDLEHSEMTEELFHVEYGDGDGDMDGREVAAAIELAAA